ncbi:MAG TPA: Spy/CpxP family protein refolding chaperone [Thermoanaerobaculales bacterium]|nr:Spy/CpxP family protein refolding chaperone [Thermoanaerobaculales bacterium]
MNATRFLITTVAMAATAVPGAALAQGYGGHHGHGAPPGFGGCDELGGPGAHFFEHMLPRLTEELDLTEAQQGRIQAILDEDLPAIDAMRDRLRDAHREFRESHPPGEFDEAAVRAFAEAQAQAHVELMVAGARTRARVHAVLTAQQQDQLQQMRDRRGRRGGPPPDRGPDLE